MTNITCENVLTRTDADGPITLPFQTMLHHRKYETGCELKDKYVYLNGQRKLRKSAKQQDLEAL